MKIGRRLIYDLATGEILHDAGEREGHVRVTSAEEDYPAYNPAAHGTLELEYGARADEFENAGSMHVEGGQLVIIPRLTLALDKPTIQADGVDVATVTISHADYGAALYTVSVSGQTYQTLDDVIQVTCDVPGLLQIVVSSALYGAAMVEVTAV